MDTETYMSKAAAQQVRFREPARAFGHAGPPEHASEHVVHRVHVVVESAVRPRPRRHRLLRRSFRAKVRESGGAKILQEAAG